jgi:TolA-binding protein
MRLLTAFSCLLLAASAQVADARKAAPLAAKPETPDADRDYARARELVEAGQEDSALLALSDFLRWHPQSAKADDAQYFMGEVYYRKRDFARAVDEFRRVFEYKGRQGADRIPEAGVRLGEAWSHQGEPDKARIEWEAVLRTFPKSEAARMAEERLAGEIPQ